MKKEYVLWGIRNGEENIIRVNGNEVQKNKEIAEEMKDILLKRNDFESIRIQEIDIESDNIKELFLKAIK